MKTDSRRCVNISDPHVIDRKPPTRAITTGLSEEILYRWLHLGQGTREISRGLRIGDRELVENELKRRVTAIGPVRPPRLADLWLRKTA